MTICYRCGRCGWRLFTSCENAYICTHCAHGAVISRLEITSADGGPLQVVVHGD